MDDFILFVRACAIAFDSPPVLRHVRNGMAAKEFLSRGDNQPSVIVSDLNMPRMSGIQLLEWVRTQTFLQRVSFVVLSSSNSKQDIGAAQRLGADGYFSKPTRPSELVEFIKRMGQVTRGATDG